MADGASLHCPPEMAIPHLLRPFLRSAQAGVPFQPYHILAYQSEEKLQALVNTLMDYIDALYDHQMRCPRDISYPELEEYWNQPPTMNNELQNNNTEVLPHSFEQQYGASSWFSEFEQGMKRRLMSDDELSGGWVSFLWIAFSHLGALSRPRFWDGLIKYQEEVIGHRVWVKVEGLQQRSGWSVELEATHQSLFDALQDAAMLAVITMRMHFPHEFQGTPFIVLPMFPRHRSKLDYPIVSSALTDTFMGIMGISAVDVVDLQKKRFLSYYREYSEFSTCCLALKEHVLKKQQALAELKKMLKELPRGPK